MLISLGFIAGAVLGSFTKALADRSLAGRTFWGRSYCRRCKHDLRWYDLFPIVSYFLLKGKCRYCRSAIGIEYLLVEVVMGILIGFLFWQSLGSVFDLAFQTFFITVLAILFLTDLKKMLIPDRIVLPAIAISLIYLIVTAILKSTEALVGGILMGLLIGGFFYSLILITKGKGMGGGDVKLGALMGLGLGFPASLVAVTAAFLTGAVYAVILILLGKKRFGEHIAFGPFLVMGSLIALFWGDKIINWYLRLGT